MGSKFIEQKHYAEKNKHIRERERAIIGLRL